ncbi:uncharacterized protein MONOS_6329 [Monocercomonoides exilis]|uniref:uncharacterized protein n=1 Tax=Monocercomonoides exilis TaxID=2049356 RepID=UPI003559DE83|nr:hypothetical protein MONOS_6329 [Monocercomonoides exilis]|eukprot:MONOS_6329.1-p1 / transcript=MONOS_6329.1 / gene=MONOS_6329 / organism=Monocercomonoides_exilis_PA203 / gene_product=unspecified product / transcript_product=unspecified product / location=Mono_scaffold00198:7120-7302(+) / protein_length=61 / sequence_SO=supercontig / SO=protein_coding / is_pseudo=false
MISLEEFSPDRIRQFYVDVVKEEYKKGVPFGLFETIPIAGYVTICNYQEKVDYITEAIRS